MARPCTVCLHGRLSEINKALVLGTGLRQTSNRFAQWGRLSIYALHRHAHAHISDKAKAAIIAGAQSQTDAIDQAELKAHTERRNLADLLYHRQIIEQEIGRARDLLDFTAISSLEARLHANILQTSRLIGELPTAPSTVHNTLIITPEYARFRTALVTALKPYPDARRAVIGVLREMDGPTLEHADVHQ